jgi:hypothetical protein
VKITLCRTDQALPTNLESARALLFGALDGFNRDDKRAWRKFWARLFKLEPGEMAVAEMVFPRSGPFHRRHMAIEQSVFDAQERFENFESLRNWMKIGAGHCEWVPGPKGAVVPIPKSISYASIDDEEFRVFHDNTVAFLRGGHAANVLWPHLKGPRAAEMMEVILKGFGE